MRIRAYNKDEDEDKLMKMIESEGKEWACYSDDSVSDKYRLALNRNHRCLTESMLRASHNGR